MTEHPMIRDNMPRHDRLRYITHGLVGSDTAAYLTDPEQRAAVEVAGGMALQLVDDARSRGFQQAIETLASDLAQAVDTAHGRHPDPPAWARDLPRLDPAVVAELRESVDRARADRQPPASGPPSGPDA